MPALPGGLRASDLTTGALVSPFTMLSTSPWPTVSDVANKLGSVQLPDALPSDLLAELAYILPAVIAEFQSPVGRKPGAGSGTGRLFGNTTASTRVFEGSGYPDLVIDDYDPAQSLTVTVNGVLLGDVAAVFGRGGNPTNVITRKPNNFYPNAAYTMGSIFPIGSQIAVTATWGAPVTADIWEAIRCEAAHRAIVQGYVSLTGVGTILTMGEFTVNDSAGVSAWEKSSPIAKFHQTYLDCVNRYCENQERERSVLALTFV